MTSIAAKGCDSAPDWPNGSPSKSRYRFELATADDDFALRQVLEATPMEGSISIAFRREPSWFDAALVDGRRRDVLVCRDTTSGRVVGQGCRSIRDVFVNCRRTNVGYLSNLRLLPEHRSRGLLARGYRFLRELHRDGEAPYYLTTIAAKNDVALRMLTSARAGLPRYHLLGGYHTLAIPLRRERTKAVAPTQHVRPATSEDLPRLLDFWNEHGLRRQFFPQLRKEDFFDSTGMMRGLNSDSILLYERGGKVAGTLAAWDQNAFRQIVVRSYHGALGWARHAYNALARCRGGHGLPEPGGAFRYLLAALPVIVNDDAHVFEALLTAQMRRAASGPWSHLLVGLHDADPLLPVARRFRSTEYVTHAYLVCWPDGEEARAQLDDRPLYLELGSL